MSPLPRDPGAAPSPSPTGLKRIGSANILLVSPRTNMVGLRSPPGHLGSTVLGESRTT